VSQAKLRLGACFAGAYRRRRHCLKETIMKIKVIKKASNVKPTGYCIQWVDDPPMNKK
jgi:hypothetical protein